MKLVAQIWHLQIKVESLAINKFEMTPWGRKQQMVCGFIAVRDKQKKPQFFVLSVTTTKKEVTVSATSQMLTGL